MAKFCIFCRFWNKKTKQICEILQNFCKFWVGQKIFVLMSFWVFSSGNGRTGRDMHYFLFSKFFRIFFWSRKFEAKVDFSDFASTNSIEIFVIFRNFLGFGARVGRILPFGEERIERYVDTSEKWMVEYCDVLGSFLHCKIVGIITSLNRRGFVRAFEVLYGKGPRCDVAILTSPAVSSAALARWRLVDPVPTGLRFFLLYVNLFGRDSGCRFSGRARQFFWRRWKLHFFEDFTRFLCVFRVEFVKRYKMRLWTLR